MSGRPISPEAVDTAVERAALLSVFLLSVTRNIESFQGTRLFVSIISIRESPEIPDGLTRGPGEAPRVHGTRQGRSNLFRETISDIWS
jgi:hypothetical protein